MDELPDPLDPHRVHDRDSFFVFVQALAADRRVAILAEKATHSSPYGPDAGGWENTTIEAFLEAAVAWAESTGMGARQGLKDLPSWQSFAVFLSCGKDYE